jgi:hypothetical protein
LAEAVIEIRDLTKTYRRRLSRRTVFAVKGLNMTVSNSAAAVLYGGKI